MAKKKKKAPSDNTIVVNKKARHDYSLGECYEAGLVLEGWEVKSIREKKVQIRDSYMLLKEGEAWLLGLTITPLLSASTHVHPDQSRTRKLLLHRKEIASLIGAVERKGLTVIPTRLYWKKGRVKVELSLAKGKKLYDKRAAEREKDWQRDKERLRKIR